MELRHLRYFVAVAEELHFRRAAERLHVAQPAVSEQVRKLECELGVTLFERTPRAVALTEAGVLLLEDARRILRQADAASRTARMAGAATTARLRLGYTPLGLPLAVSDALGRMGRALRRPRIELERGDARALLADVRAGSLDAAVVHLPAPTAGLRVADIGPESLLAALPSGGAPADDPIALEDVPAWRVLLMRRAVDPAFHDAVVGTLQRGQLAATLVESAAPTMDHLLLEVTTGAGVAILPGAVAHRATLPGVDLRPIDELEPSARVGLATRSEQPSATLVALLDLIAFAGRAPAPRAAVAA